MLFVTFKSQRVAKFGDKERAVLLADASIIRNRLKIDAALYNARAVMRLQEKHGSFKAWLVRHHPQDLSTWVRLFRSEFRFMGPEIVNEFLMSTGYLEGAHKPSCPVYKRIVALQPPWWLAQKQRGRV